MVCPSSSIAMVFGGVGTCLKNVAGFGDLLDLWCKTWKVLLEY